MVPNCCERKGWMLFAPCVNRNSYFIKTEQEREEYGHNDFIFDEATARMASPEHLESGADADIFAGACRSDGIPLRDV